MNYFLFTPRVHLHTNIRRWPVIFTPLFMLFSLPAQASLQFLEANWLKYWLLNDFLVETLPSEKSPSLSLCLFSTLPSSLISPSLPQLQLHIISGNFSLSTF